MYFKAFPKIYYQFDSQYNKFIQVLTDITSNVRIRKNVLESITLYDEYDIKDGETPEIIAEKVYGNPEYHWTIMLANQRYDYLNDFPISSVELYEHALDKYGSEHIHNVHHYEKNGDFAEASANIKLNNIEGFNVNDFIEAVPSTIGIVQAIGVNEITLEQYNGSYSAGLKCILKDGLSDIGKITFNITDDATYNGDIATLKIPNSVLNLVNVGDILESLPVANARIVSLAPLEQTLNIVMDYGRFGIDGSTQCTARGIRRNSETLINEFIKLPILFIIEPDMFTINDTYEIITNFMFEEQENEKKRRIKLISPQLIDQVLSEFKELMI
jgi:hypothetical protein